MQKWEYCELELIIGGPITGRAANLVFFQKDGKHKTYSKEFGVIMAMLGAEGWEMCGSSARIETGFTVGAHKINYIFKRSVEDDNPKPS